jgi:choline dehydrogenase-like flavoprotein
MNNDDFDVIIMGTGLTASIVADHFIKQNKRVLMLERGLDAPYAPMSKKDLWFEDTIASVENQSMITRNSWAYNQGLHSNITTDVFNEDAFDDLVAIENQNPNFRFDYNMRLGYGGSAAVWSGRVWRFYDQCFKTKSLYGYGIDWPFKAKDLIQYYDMAENRLNVSGPKDDNWPWPQNFKYEAFEFTSLDNKLKKIIGDDFRFFQTANAVKNLPPEQGGCVAAKSCVSFCPANALTRPHISWLEPHRQNKNLTIEFDTIVSSLSTNPTSRLIEAINVIDRAGRKKSIRVPSETFVFLCGNTIENLRVCLNSNNQENNGIANNNKLLGTYFSSHGAVVSEIVSTEDLSPGKSRPSTMAGLDVKLGTDRFKQNSFMLEVSNFNWRYGSSHVAFQKFRKKTGHWGRSLFKNAKEKLSRSTIVTAVFETELQKDNFVSLSKEKDKFGIPLAKVNYSMSKRDLSTYTYLKQYLKNLEKADTCKSSRIAGEGLNGNQPIGGYIMSNHPNKGVTDQYGRSWEHKNLYFTGGGLFCSTSPFNPTLTITANTLRQLSDPRLEVVENEL